MPRCQGHGRLNGRQSERARRRRRRAERADRRRAVPSTLVIVARVHHLAKAALELESDDIGFEQRRPARMRDFTRRENGGNQRAARMRERHEAHVVEVERVSGDAVRERRPARARSGLGADHDARARSFGNRDRLGRPRDRFDGARQRDADGVANRRRRARQRRRRRHSGRNEFSKPFGVAHLQYDRGKPSTCSAT